jgi:hypothetical protein
MNNIPSSLSLGSVPENLLSSTNQLMNQSALLNGSQPLPITLQEDVDQSSSQQGGKKEVKPKKVDKSKSKTKKEDKPKPKKVDKPKTKQIDTFLKQDLEKIAKKHDVNLKMSDGKLKTKKQLFDSLKRKKLV